MNFKTVTGLVPTASVKRADAHAHVWIAPPDGVSPASRLELNNLAAIKAELQDFKAAGGTTLIDCQPGGCGRDARRLFELAQITGLHITAVTGFHRQTYYAPDYWLWSASMEEAAQHFIHELTVGMVETGSTLPASVLKVGYEGVIAGQTRVLMEAVAAAAQQTGALILFHTEAGQNVEALLPFFGNRGLAPHRLYFCHVDKRPDAGLHRELAQSGVLLGYDTFARPQYDPEHGVWPLLKTMVASGLDAHIALGLDLARASLWQCYGGKPGLCFLPHQVLSRLRQEGFSEQSIDRLTAANIASYLVWQ